MSTLAVRQRNDKMKSVITDRREGPQQQQSLLVKRRAVSVYAAADSLWQ